MNLFGWVRYGRARTPVVDDLYNQRHDSMPHLGAKLRDADDCGANRDFMRLMILLASVLAFFVVMLSIAVLAHASDDGRFTGSPLKAWFDKLASGRGLCCSFADGVAIEDVDWDTYAGQDGGVHYRVRIEGEWLDVPDAAVVAEPNRFGRAVAWPYQQDGATQIRCFLPGAGA